ncbi:hypothetical protein T4C_5876 [Trichinella pseudospiralis]|uniref:Uncharacterized protein n=1 Tax=Trichinella pseudospiralis TaxID=6337 RepID=A0A0V1K8E0_TRIPS|nr:hypothetical protein T4C_5876 [Trichinella pseudospiralis]
MKCLMFPLLNDYNKDVQAFSKFDSSRWIFCVVSNRLFANSFFKFTIAKLHPRYCAYSIFC